MSLPEILYRLKNAMQKRIEKVRDVGKFRKVKAELTSSKILDIQCKTGLYKPVINIFGKQINYLEDIDWHMDMNSLKRFEKSFSKDIHILADTSLSAKHVWEMNRLLFLPQICLNYYLSEDKKYLEQFARITTDWIDNNPYLTGVNWYSNIEANIRLINWFFCWEILHVNDLIKTNKELRTFVNEKWLPAIHLHCEFSFRNPSKYSSANNHLISEYAGLFIATSLWKFKESKKWNIHAKKGLEKEIKKQHSPDGVNKEEAAEYIQFITDFFLLAFIVAERTNNSFSNDYRNLLHKIFTYINNFTDIKGNFPNYGDEDDGHVILLEQGHYNNFKSLLTSGTILFKDPDLKVKSNGYDVKNQILFGEEGRTIYDTVSQSGQLPGSCLYKKEGHFILRGNEKENEIYLHFDAAGLGFLSIAAHGHADALSLILRIQGEDILVDSGTYTYHTDPDWRKYFIGTISHNTIKINKKNQALIGGPTLWLRHYKTKIHHAESNGEYDKIIASHNGYKCEGITHSRELILNKSQKNISITDELISGSGKEYFIEFPLHIHPSVTVNKKDEKTFVLSKNKKQLAKIECDPSLDLTIVKGSKDPILGWFSGSFYRKEPANVIYQTLKTNRTISVKTEIKIY